MTGSGFYQDVPIFTSSAPFHNFNVVFKLTFSHHDKSVHLMTSAVGIVTELE